MSKLVREKEALMGQKKTEIRGCLTLGTIPTVQVHPKILAIKL
jgi:hypothetical protein